MEHNDQKLRKSRRLRHHHVKGEPLQPAAQTESKSLLEKITGSTTGLISIGVLSISLVVVTCYLIHQSHQPKHVYLRSVEIPTAKTPEPITQAQQVVQPVRSVETILAEEQATPVTPPVDKYVDSSQISTGSSEHSSGSSGGKTHVKGYTRKDGTYVAPYDRSKPHRHK